jgi:magnesium transporter
MKILAIIYAIFIPLTLITGIYGMNFEHMPELTHPVAYPVVLGSIGIIGVTMAIFFKIRRWF